MLRRTPGRDGAGYHDADMHGTRHAYGTEYSRTMVPGWHIFMIMTHLDTVLSHDLSAA